MCPHWEIHSASDGIETIAPALVSDTRIDPYLVWADATHYRDLGGEPHGRIPVAIELPRGNTARQFAQEIERNGWQEWIWMSALYRDPPPVLEASRFCTAHVTREFFMRLNTDLAGRFERFTQALSIVAQGKTQRHALRVDREPLAPALPHTDVGGVIVGVCDEDLAFSHPRFAQEGSVARTRFQSFWNQNDASGAAAGLGYGSELLKHQMDALLADATHAAEAAQAAGGARVHGFAHHGAAAAELAGRYPAAWRRGVSVQPATDHDAPLPMIGVQLKQCCRPGRDAFGPCRETEILDAVRYIVRRAWDIGGDACHALVSVNAGNAAWRQDGSSLIEGALDELMDTGACSVVLPSGNDDVSGCSAALSIADRAELPWPVPAHSTTPSFAEIWLSGDGDAPSVDVQIVPPGGVESAWLTLGEIGIYTRGGDAICTVVHLGRGARGEGHMILVALAPTAARNAMRRAPAGQWLIRLRNNAHSDVSACAWMQCDESSDESPLLDPSHSRDGGF